MNRLQQDSLAGCAVDAARVAGEYALTHYNRRTETFLRSAHDIKLQLDIECQERASAIIRKGYPRHAILGEEGGHLDLDAEVCWIIDPIDGSVNFSHGLPLWCCSVAALSEKKIIAGAVFIPMLNQVYAATLNGPALCNGSPIRVSTVSTLANATVAVSAAARDMDEGRSIRVLEELLPICQKVRIYGSAAIDLCYVASGQFDAYAEPSIHLWDCAAGALVVARSGGRIEVLESLDAIRMRMIASNGLLHEAFGSAVRRGLSVQAATSTPVPSPWDSAH